jgi:hypothetical protein
MNHIIHNISIILIFFGIILLTINLTKSYNKCPIIINEKQQINQNNIYQERPSKMYDKMFSQPELWMGYADFDIKNFNKKLI